MNLSDLSTKVSMLNSSPTTYNHEQIGEVEEGRDIAKLEHNGQKGHAILESPEVHESQLASSKNSKPSSEHGSPNAEESTDARPLDLETSTLPINRTNLIIYPFGNIICGPDQRNRSGHLPCCGGLCSIFTYIVWVHVVFILIVSAIGFPLLPPEMYPILCAVILCALTCLAAFVITGTTDPGVVKPQSMVQLEEQRKKHPGLADDANRKLCDICNVYVDLSTRHCSRCNACVREIDHHCGVTGICIGARNKVHFQMIFFFSALTWWYVPVVIAFGIVAVVFTIGENPDFDKFDKLTTVSYIVAGIMYLIYLLAIWWWLAATFGCLQMDHVFGCLPNPCFEVHKHMCRKPSRGYPHTEWISLIDRQPVFRNCCKDTCTLPYQEFYGTTTEHSNYTKAGNDAL